MKKNSRNLCFILVACLLVFCQKRVFKTITVKGTVIDWYTGKPARGTVHIYARDAHSNSESFPPFASFALDDNGSFNKTFKASRSGDYSISMPGKNEHLAIKDNSTHDFGTVEYEHPFVCEVTLKYLSWKDATINFDNGPSFQPYTNTVFYHTLPLTRSNYEENHKYYLNYRINPKNDVSQIYSLKIPITQGDTVRTEITF